MPSGLNPGTWSELFAIFSLVREPTTLILDEFPYLVSTQKSLPSLLQRWVDHDRPSHVQLVLLGSSQTMMQDLFLNATAPLYERASLLMQIGPMSYVHFCEACSLDPRAPQSFEQFSLVGGVPKYWEFIDPKRAPAENADRLYFDKSARLAHEPSRLLSDERIQGQQATFILEAIGRGAHRSSEIASRMGMPQISLGRPLQKLLNTSLVRRDVPFGENARGAKRTLYRLDDVALSFWFGVYSPHRSRWHHYDTEKKMVLIREHASSILESSFRALYRDASSYWEGGGLEIDSVRFNPSNLDELIISEIKWRSLNSSAMRKIQKGLVEKFERSKLASKYALKDAEVLDLSGVLKKCVESEG